MKIIELLSSSDIETQFLGIQLLESHPDYENFKDKLHHLISSLPNYSIYELIRRFKQYYFSDQIHYETFKNELLKFCSNNIISILKYYNIDI